MFILYFTKVDHLYNTIHLVGKTFFHNSVVVCLLWLTLQQCVMLSKDWVVILQP